MDLQALIRGAHDGQLRQLAAKRQTQQELIDALIDALRVQVIPPVDKNGVVSMDWAEDRARNFVTWLVVEYDVEKAVIR